MTEINALDNESLEKVSGGMSAESCKYNVGDRVIVQIYPEYGVGTVLNTYLNHRVWICRVLFDSGEMEADQNEFLPA